jgi:predicted nuclease of predicted toxin-antitoxin system
MKFVIDMNLSPEWAEVLTKAGFTAVHWSSIGEITAEDEEILDWARYNGFTVITLDYDFATLLAITGSTQPSVIQVRREDSTPEALKDTLLEIIQRYSTPIADGALMVIDEKKIRLRLLPLK